MWRTSLIVSYEIACNVHFLHFRPKFKICKNNDKNIIAEENQWYNRYDNILSYSIYRSHILQSWETWLEYIHASYTVIMKKHFQPRMIHKAPAAEDNRDLPPLPCCIA